MRPLVVSSPSTDSISDKSSAELYKTYLQKTWCCCQASKRLHTQQVASDQCCLTDCSHSYLVSQTALTPGGSLIELCGDRLTQLILEITILCFIKMSCVWQLELYGQMQISDSPKESKSSGGFYSVREPHWRRPCNSPRYVPSNVRQHWVIQNLSPIILNSWFFNKQLSPQLPCLWNPGLSHGFAALISQPLWRRAAKILGVTATQIHFWPSHVQPGPVAQHWLLVDQWWPNASVGSRVLSRSKNNMYSMPCDVVEAMWPHKKRVARPFWNVFELGMLKS